MADIAFGDLVRAVRDLDQPHKEALLAILMPEVTPRIPITRESILAEMEAFRAAGKFDLGESLRDKYPAAADEDLSEATLRGLLRGIGKEWEDELDELSD